MSTRGVILAGVTAVASLLCCGHAYAQSSSEPKDSATVMTIDVTAPRPVAAAMDVIEKRYGVAIDYSDPVYASTQDTQLLYTLHCSLCSVAKPGGESVGGKPPVMGPHDIPLQSPILIPRIWTLKIQYLENSEAPRVAPYFHCNLASGTCPAVSARPVGGITALIGKVLARFAAEGGTVFTVRKIATRYGSRWEVYPLKARNAVGSFVPQTDFLGTIIRVPNISIRGGVRALVAQRLARRWGIKFVLADQTLPTNVVVPRVKRAVAADTIPEGTGTPSSVRRVVIGGIGPTSVIRMFYGPDSQTYVINIVPLPYREPARPPTPAPVPAHMSRPHPLLPIQWCMFATHPKGNFEFQTALAKAGYLLTAPTKKWDPNAVAALRRFQVANGLQPTGKCDINTAQKLLPFLPDGPTRLVPAKPAMDSQLASWLANTPDGRKEIAEALKKAGFYHGPVTSSAINSEAVAALKAFQEANGLPPSGGFTYQTAEKLAPFLPQPRN